MPSFVALKVTSSVEEDEVKGELAVGDGSDVEEVRFE